ncbi:MAG: uroporphyrinogen decarboxylase family protein [Sedimentisphaerales bacterium]
MATLRGEPVDRPAVNFYEVGGFRIDPSDPDEFNVYNDPSWQPLLRLAEEHSDVIRMRSPIKSRSHEVNVSHYKMLEYVEDGCRFSRVRLQAGGRTLTSLTRRCPDVDTLWTIEHLLKSVDDLKAYLEVPDEVFAEEVDVTALIEEDQRLAEKGIIMIDTDHIYARTEATAKAFPGHLWRIYGPEFATEPYLPPHLFKDYVVRYTGPMVEMIQKHGGFARIHCHGRIRAVLDYIAEMGATAIDPIEPPPQGDVELSEVRRRYGRELVLFGNIEFADIEHAEPAEFEKIVAKALKDGTDGEGKGFVLMPSSAPISRTISSKVMANYETMIHLAANFGS